jgi:glycogen debranching enzyme
MSATSAPRSTGNGPLDLPTSGDAEPLVRAHGAMFLVTDRRGDITPAGARELGFFQSDTRYLSHYAFSIAEGQLVRLSAETGDDATNQIDLMLADLEGAEFLDDPRNFMHICRRQILDSSFLEQIELTSFLHEEVELTMKLEFGADFADIFEVRGARRTTRGVTRAPVVSGASVVLAYDGVEGSRYATHVGFVPEPSSLTADTATFRVRVAPGESQRVEIRVSQSVNTDTAPAPGPTFQERENRLRDEARAFRAASTSFTCDNGRLQHVLDQSIADVHALSIPMETGGILGAGIPWFCCPFGRDALITAFELLTVNPDIAWTALRTLAAYQGKQMVDETEEEPGKIFHELRSGEMTRAKETPHSPYYGSIDATPLFVILAEEAFRFSADHAKLAALRPAIVAALAWLDARSDGGRELVTYARKTSKGIENQCWKDSRAGVSSPNGRRAIAPIAVCEVQGYCIDAYARGARILSALGDAALAATYAARATEMRATFERRFWLEDRGRYAYAIDGEGHVLDTIVSNAGHLLWSGVVPKDRAAATGRLLLSAESFSGFGIRTLAEGQKVYNPLSYHNGTVWPHDNALIARGLAHYDLGAEALRVFDGMHEAMGYFRDRRLPELFCGIGKAAGPLVRYPVACSPQAWAAAAPFLLLQSILGVYADAPAGRLLIRNPQLPHYVTRLEMHDMRIGKSQVSLRFRRDGRQCHVERLDVKGAPLRIDIELA